MARTQGKKRAVLVTSEKKSSTGLANLNMNAGSLNPHIGLQSPSQQVRQQTHPGMHNAHISTSRNMFQQQQPHLHQQSSSGRNDLAGDVAPVRSSVSSVPGGGTIDQAYGSTDSYDNNKQHRTAQSFPHVAPLQHIPQQPQARTLSGNQATQQPYPSPNLYTPQPSLQSPFLNSHSQFQGQQATSEAPNFYPPTQSPRSQHSGPSAYYPPEKTDSMAATATMQRPYPPMYHTPQSNSPASVTSPQTHDPARPMYSQQPSQLSQPMYPYQYGMNSVHQATYGQHHSQPQQHQMNPQSMMPYQTTNAHIPQSQVAPHHSTVASSPRLKSEQQNQHYQLKSEPPQMKYDQNQSYQHTPQARSSMLQQQQSHPNPMSQSPGLTQQQVAQQPQQHTPQLPQAQQQQSSQHQVPQHNPNLPPNSNAAPGPIPATTPLVVKQVGGVQWIAFEYSRDRVKMEYTIRCDVESVNPEKLTQEFKSENCVYPRACVPKEQYKGNRLSYETECNQVGWALADLNACLRGKRGLIQRAVDSWRNSNQDPRLRSRRVRRQAKMTGRNKVPTSGSGQAAGSTGSTGLPGPNSMAAPNRPPGSMSNPQSQILHHPHDVSPTGHDSSGMPPYPGQQAYRQNSTPQHMASPNDLRQGHVFAGYPNYATSLPPSMGPSMAPAMQPGMHHLGRPGGTAMASKEQEEKDEEDNALFGELPEGKRRKFILVEDTQKNARVRVKVTLDQIEMSEIPDSYRKQNSVFPRTYFPVQMQTTTDPTRGNRFVEEGEEVDNGVPSLGQMAVSVQTSDGEAEVSVPQISKSKRGREQKINELGYRMAWGQGRVFSGRPIFLARALDAYRSKQRSALLAAGSEPLTIPAHLEIRPGKRKWQERTKTATQAPTPPNATTD